MFGLMICGGALAFLVVAIGDLELRLLREPAIGKASFELLEVLHRVGPLLLGHGVLRFAVEALRRPAGSFVVFLARKDAAAAEEQRDQGKK